MLNSILLVSTVTTFHVTKGAAAYALSLAEHFGANISALILDLPGAVAMTDDGPHNVETIDFSMAFKHATDDIRGEADRRGLSLFSIESWSRALGVLAAVTDLARLHDAVIMGCDPTGMLSEQGIAEHVMFEAGRPLFLIPADHREPFAAKKVLLAWDNSPSSARALGVAMPMLLKAETVTLVQIGGEKDIASTLSDPDIAEYLQRRGLNVEIIHRVRGKSGVGDALLAAAQEHSADLLVMGGYGHSRLRQFLLGGVTRRMFDGAPMPLMLVH